MVNYLEHTLFSIHCNALQIIAYFDEVEVCNPLGSHSGLQKLGTVKLLMLVATLFSIFASMSN